VCHSAQPYTVYTPTDSPIARFIFFCFFGFVLIPYHRTFKLNDGSGHGHGPESVVEAYKRELRVKKSAPNGDVKIGYYSFFLLSNDHTSRSVWLFIDTDLN